MGKHKVEKYKSYPPIKVGGKRLGLNVSRTIQETRIAAASDSEDEEEPTFTINTCHARNERATIREVIKQMGWKETKATGEGDLLWYYSALREIDQKILNYRT